MINYCQIYTTIKKIHYTKYFKGTKLEKLGRSETTINAINKSFIT